ncbi:hypothetical protein HZS_4612 [Henneguya salminicola]|nr:hypothetical protein HZS_4612 [Henneguya salminicola]
MGYKWMSRNIADYFEKRLINGINNDFPDSIIFWATSTLSKQFITLESKINKILLRIQLLAVVPISEIFEAILLRKSVIQ